MIQTFARTRWSRKHPDGFSYLNETAERPTDHLEESKDENQN
jgi:hypothetical protein